MMVKLSLHDRDVLRRLAEEQAEVAALPVHREKAELWRRLNDLEPVRPMVWINEIPWNEMNYQDELTLQINPENPWARQQEEGLRLLLYQWRHMPADMIVNDYLSCPLVIHTSGFGLDVKEEIVRSDATSEVVSHRYFPQILNDRDVEKIQTPLVTLDAETTEANYQRMCEVYDGILPVRKVGIKGEWFAPLDQLVMWWGVERLFTDLIERSDLVKEAVARLVEARLSELDQWEALNLLTRNDDNTRIGSGGYGYTRELPGAGYDENRARASDLWGCATAQLFGAVSPKMHWEFALQYEMRWLERWGMTYYGCCEPVDNKYSILQRIPNLRKVSASPWVKIERAVRDLGGRYVLSRKPNPAVLAEDNWHPEVARADLVEFLEQARGCAVEVILKDISTVRYQPQRLWEWEKLAMQVVEDYRL